MWILKTREKEPCTLEHNTTWFIQFPDSESDIPVSDICDLIPYDTVRLDYVES